MADSPDHDGPRPANPRPEVPAAPGDGPAIALGRIPSGLFVISWQEAGADRTMLASWVMQAGFAPPVVSVAVAPSRDLLVASRFSPAKTRSQGSRFSAPRGGERPSPPHPAGSNAGERAKRPRATMWSSWPRWWEGIAVRASHPSCMCGKMGYVTDPGRTPIGVDHRGG
jgi:hypothetical protein